MLMMLGRLSTKNMRAGDVLVACHAPKKHTDADDARRQSTKNQAQLMLMTFTRCQKRTELMLMMLGRLSTKTTCS